MKRLTTRNGLADFTSECTMEDVKRKLKEYEDAEENGTLVRLPCRIGDTVYYIYSKYSKCSAFQQEFNEGTCQGCNADGCDSKKMYYIHEFIAPSLRWIVSKMDDFGKIAFTAKEEAEKALKEMRDR